MKSIKKGFGIFFLMAVLVCCFVLQASAASYTFAYPAQGDYYIVPANNSNYAFDLSGGASTEGTKFQIWEKNGTNAQIFTLKQVTGEWYKLVHKASGMVVNVEYGVSANGTRLQLYHDDGTDACYFRFVKVPGQSSYAIQSKIAPYRFIHMNNGSGFNGDILHLWEGYNANSQWKLETANLAFPSDGDYCIVSESHSNYAFDLSGGASTEGTKFQVWEKNGTDAQIFTIKKVAGEWYKLVHKASGMVVNVEYGVSANGTRLQLYHDDGTDACYFRFVKIPGRSSYAIQSKIEPYRFIHMNNGSGFNGDILHLWEGYNANAQWKLEPTTYVPPYDKKVNEFLSDSRWKVGTSWGGGEAPKLSKHTSWGCCAYVWDFAQYVYGKAANNGTRFTSANEIKTGDILYVTPMHWMVVLYRNGNSLDIVHGNWGGKVSRNKYTLSGNKIGKKTFSYGYHFQ